MSCFDQAIAVVLKHEGGFSNNPADPGGATNYGISLRWLRSQGLTGDMDNDGDVDIYDIIKLTSADAEEFYHDHWWERYNYDRFDDCLVATKVLDMSVNMGAKQAHKLLQRALNDLGERLVVDGVVGPLTMLASNKATPEKLMESLRAEQKRFYSRLIAKRPQLAVFRNGWYSRAMA